MKRFISVFALILVFSITLVTPCFAAKTDVATFSDDYKFMELNGIGYSSFDSTLIYTDYYYDYYYDYYEDVYYSFENMDSDSSTHTPPDYPEEEITVKLTDEQSANIETIEINTTNQKAVIYADICCNDGFTISVSYIRNDLKDEYNKLIKGESEKYTVDFIWPDGNTVVADRSSFLNGNKTKIKFYYEETYDVLVFTEDKSICLAIGSVISNNDKYYFINFIDSPIESTYDLWDYEGATELEVIEITDRELIQNLETAEQKYFDDDLGYLYNDELSENISKAFFIIVFAVAPVVIFIVSLILSFKAKKKLYKKLLLAVCGLSLAEIATFIYIAFTLFTARA